MNVVVNNLINGSTPTAYMSVSCGTNPMSGITTGGYTAVTGNSNVTACINPWGNPCSQNWSDPTDPLGANLASSFMRPFTFTAANTLSMQQTFSFSAGFYDFATSTTTTAAVA